MLYVHNSLLYGEWNSDEQEQFENTNGNSLTVNRRTDKVVAPKGKRTNNDAKQYTETLRSNTTKLTKTVVKSGAPES